jgi:hypothetical protein
MYGVDQRYHIVNRGFWQNPMPQIEDMPWPVFGSLKDFLGFLSDKFRLRK